MTRRFPVSPRRRTRGLDVPSADASHAMLRGTPDEREDAVRAIVPTAAQLMRDADFQEALSFAKAQVETPRGHVRPGVAMANIDLDAPLRQGLQFARPVGLDFHQLREIPERFIPLKLIARTRIRQVQRFLTRPKYDWMPGFKIVFADPQRELRDEDKARLSWLHRFVMSCGAEFDPRVARALQRDHVHDFAAKHLEDSLYLDHAPVELIPTHSGRVHGFAAVDAAKIFRTDPTFGLRDDFDGPAELNLLMKRRDFGAAENIVAVYVDEGRLMAQYSHMDLLLPVRNPTTDSRYYGYGRAEPEELLSIATAFLNAFTMNARSISDSAIPRGVWNVMGDYSETEIERLRLMFNRDLRGAHNRGRVPIMVNNQPDAGSGVTFVPTGAQVEEVMYARWMTLLMAVSCALYSMDPAEISFESYSASTSSLSGSDTEAKLTSGADKGLATLLSRYGRTLSEIVQTVDDECTIEWTGLDYTKEEAMAQEQAAMNFGEIRARAGLSNDAYDESVLNTPLNAAVTAMYQQSLAPAQPDPSAPGAPDPNAQDDPGAPQGPDGQRRFTDHEGGAWQVEQGQPSAPAAPAAELAKADVILESWPRVE